MSGRPRKMMQDSMYKYSSLETSDDEEYQPSSIQKPMLSSKAAPSHGEAVNKSTKRKREEEESGKAGPAQADAVVERSVRRKREENVQKEQEIAQKDISRKERELARKVEELKEWEDELDTRAKEIVFDEKKVKRRLEEIKKITEDLVVVHSTRKEMSTDDLTEELNKLRMEVREIKILVLSQGQRELKEAIMEKTEGKTVEEVEKELLVEANRQRFVAKYSVLSGKTTNETIREILCHLFSPDEISQFNWAGRYGKRKFLIYENLIEVIAAICKKENKAKRKETEEALKVVLKRISHRVKSKNNTNTTNNTTTNNTTTNNTTTNNTTNNNTTNNNTTTNNTNNNINDSDEAEPSFFPETESYSLFEEH